MLIAIFAILCLYGALCPVSSRGQEINVTRITLTPSKDIHLVWDTPEETGDEPDFTPDPDDVSFDTILVAGRVYDYVVRSPGGTGFAYPIGSTTSCDDTDWSLNTRYEYHIVYHLLYWSWDATDYAWHAGGSMESDGRSYYVTVRKAEASAHQTVDSRIDMRFSDYHLKDYKFQSTLFRGGLFAGYNADNSRAARTYFKFGSLTGPLTGHSDELLWNAGGLSVYCPRLAKTGSASITCRSASDNSWDADTLVWSNAPSLVGGTGSSTAVTLSWDSTMPTGQWATFNNAADIAGAILSAAGDYSSAVLTSAILSPSEIGSGQDITASANGWAYFARNSYTESTGAFAGQDLSAYLLYAFGGPGISVGSVTLDPNFCEPGDTVTGTVDIGYTAPSGGVVVSLSSDTSGVTVPSSVTVAAGTRTATFSVDSSGASVGGAGYLDAAITASFSGGGGSATLTLYDDDF